LNPYALDRSPSGSSSGAAVAVAANLCVVAVGTETDGSIVSPASACGVVGLKPTVGLISRSGIIPISSSQDTPGPMARTVRDAALLLSVMAVTDPEDPATRASGRPRARALASISGSHALKGVRIGVVTGPFGFDARMDRLLDEKVAELQAAGARVVCWGELPVFRELDDPEREVLLYEFKDGINRYLASLGPSSPVTSLAGLIAYNDAHADAEMPYFKQQIFLLAQTKGPLSERAYRSAVEACRRYSRTEGIDRLMQLYRLDVLVSLTGSPAGRIDRVDGGPGVRHSAQPAAVAGYPSVTVPAGQIDGLPVGLSFFSRAWTEVNLLKFAADFEARTRARRPPEFLLHAREDAPSAPAVEGENRPLTSTP
jgi:amidase